MASNTGGYRGQDSKVHGTADLPTKEILVGENGLAFDAKTEQLIPDLKISNWPDVSEGRFFKGGRAGVATGRDADRGEMRG